MIFINFVNIYSLPKNDDLNIHSMIIYDKLTSKVYINISVASSSNKQLQNLEYAISIFKQNASLKCNDAVDIVYKLLPAITNIKKQTFWTNYLLIYINLLNCRLRILT